MPKEISKKTLYLLNQWRPVRACKRLPRKLKKHLLLVHGETTTAFLEGAPLYGFQT